jgi:tRNA dimethylallyltransferase
MKRAVPPAGRLDACRPILLMGPTAAGKSALATALAARLPVEIVSVDSAQVYHGMDVGTAKPTAVERGRIAHHLIDVIEPTEAYSAARFRDDALACIAAIRARRRIPLLVGGTMLYFRALREGLAGLPAADPQLRARLSCDARAQGWPALHARLAALDPATAARLQPTDAQRIQRALEVCLLTGRPMSSLLGQPGAAAVADAAGGLGEHLALALVPGDRIELHRRIERRFDAMLAAGLVDELRRLRARYPLVASLPSMRTVGYRQAWEYLEGEVDAAQFHLRAVAATRQLAKRQITWLRRTDAMVFDSLRADVVDTVLHWLDA